MPLPVCVLHQHAQFEPAAGLRLTGAMRYFPAHAHTCVPVMVYVISHVQSGQHLLWAETHPWIAATARLAPCLHITGLTTAKGATSDPKQAAASRASLAWHCQSERQSAGGCSKCRAPCIPARSRGAVGAWQTFQTTQSAFKYMLLMVVGGNSNIGHSFW